MASFRLLQLVFSPRAAVKVASFKKWPLQRGIHAATAPSSPKEIQHLQSTIEGVISEVGGKMVVADMRFSRDAFDYWRNAAIPSDSIVKDLASTWANMESINHPSMPFKFYADRTVGKKMEVFLQKMVGDVEQRITREGFNTLKGRRIVVRLADEKESKQAFDKRPVFKQESMLRELGKTEAKQEINTSKDVPFADEQALKMKEGNAEAEQAFDRRIVSQELRVKEEKQEAEQSFDGRLDVQSPDKQEVTAKMENSAVRLEGLDVQESVVKEEIFEDMQVQSAKLVMCTTHQQGATTQEDKLENQYVKEKGIGKKEGQLTSDGQRALEKEKNLEVIHRIEKGGAEMQKAESKRRLVSAQDSMGVFMKSAACAEQQSMALQKGDAEGQHVKEKEFEREDTVSAADEQKGREKGKKLGITHKTKKKEGTEMKTREAEKQTCEGGKDYSQQQSDNIVWKTRRMGKKVVHIYYDKGSAGRASLNR